MGQYISNSNMLLNGIRERNPMNSLISGYQAGEYVANRENRDIVNEAAAEQQRIAAERAQQLQTMTQIATDAYKLLPSLDIQDPQERGAAISNALNNSIKQFEDEGRTDLADEYREILDKHTNGKDIRPDLENAISLGEKMGVLQSAADKKPADVQQYEYLRGILADPNKSEAEKAFAYQQLGKGIEGGQAWTPESIRKEYDYEKYTPESVKAAEGARDPSLLVNKDMLPTEMLPLKKDWDNTTAPYRQVRQATTQLQQLLKQPGPFADVASVYQAVKLLDPNSVVREGEVGLMTAASSLFDRVMTNIAKIQDGGAIGPETRKDMVNTLQALVGLYQEDYDNLREDQSIFLGDDKVAKRVLGKKLEFPTDFGIGTPAPDGIPQDVRAAWPYLSEDEKKLWQKK